MSEGPVTQLLVGLLAAAFLLVQIAVLAGTSLGVVREHCLDPDLSRSAPGRLEVESKWTYVLFPPAALANLDPGGRCVRNSPLREALGELGAWELASPEEQVRRHLAEQLEDARSRRSAAAGWYVAAAPDL